MTTTTSTDGIFRSEGTSRADSVREMVQNTAGISNMRRVSFPEVSAGVWARPPTKYMPDSNAVTVDMSYMHPSDPGAPPLAYRQRQQSQPHPHPHQSHPSTAPPIPPPQISSHTPHQGAPVTQRGDIVGHQRTLSDVLPRLHAVHSPPIAFPHHVGSPIQEENMYLAYSSPSMMLPPHAPVYQFRTPPDLVPTSSHIFPNASTPTSPIYTHALTNTSPSPPSPSLLRHAASGPLLRAHHSTPYAMHGTYMPMGYTTHPPYAYPPPVSFVPTPSSYGSHFPPHYSPSYGFPSGQGGQWWYLPPGATVAANSFEGTQREHQPQLATGSSPVVQLDAEPPGQRNAASLPSSSETQPTWRQTNRTRVVTQAPSPTSPTSPRKKHQERRSYHPNPPAYKSEWVMWVGNVPSDVTQDEIREFFNRPLPPPSTAQRFPKDRRQVYGGVLTIFLISRSKCAFVNFESESQLEAATARFNGQPIRPDDQWCPPLVCRVRRREDDLMAGVGGQRGSGMHIKWVKEHKANVQRRQADTVGLPKDIVRPSSPLSVSSDENGGIGEGHTRPNLTRSVSNASTNSDILTRYFPRRYFVLKSLTQSDLDLSVQKNVWATQRHNEEILDQAYRTSKDVFLVFSVNKSGEFYGYARMAGPVSRDGTGVPRESAGSTAPPSSVSSFGEMSACASPSPDRDDIRTERQDAISSPDEHRIAKPSPQSAPAGRPSFALAEPHKPHHRPTHSMPNPSTSPPPGRAVGPAHASSSKLTSDALSHSSKNSLPEGTRESPEHDAVLGPILVKHGVSEADIDDRIKPWPVTEGSSEDRDARDDGTGPAWDRPFCIEWIRTDSLPFFRTWHLRNPWNHGRQVKVSRDGTELEPSVGQQLLDEWDTPPVGVDNSPGPSRAVERHRGPKSSLNPQ